MRSWIWILKFTPTVTQKGHVSNGTGYSFNATPIPWSQTRSKHRISLIPTRLQSFCPSFPAGAFIPGVPVQPVLLRYPNEMVRKNNLNAQTGCVIVTDLSGSVDYVSSVMKTLYLILQPNQISYTFFVFVFCSTVETFLFLSVRL